MMKQSNMIEGPEAFALFREAVKKILTVPKSAVLEHERQERESKGMPEKKKKPVAPKG